MQKFEDSFDGKFDEHLKLTSKGPNANKQTKIVINVAGNISSKHRYTVCCR